MRSLQQIRHWTPRYIFNRARCALRARLHPEYPWLAWPMIADLEGRLSRNDVGFEWGSGRSTLWFASRMGKLTSVEHHEDWFTQVENAVRQRGLTDSAKVMIRQL
ncbi:MAG: hypothetical protein KDB07_11650, partial [Planctomycetes bacterium]|nr:hypothetical protein [Planctomycetota bacterium]